MLKETIQHMACPVGNTTIDTSVNPQTKQTMIAGGTLRNSVITIHAGTISKAREKPMLVLNLNGVLIMMVVMLDQ